MRMTGCRKQKSPVSIEKTSRRDIVFLVTDVYPRPFRKVGFKIRRGLGCTAERRVKVVITS